MIPDLNDGGHLPPGRYRASLDEIHDRFVLNPQFASSSTRAEIWNGFLDYLAAWLEAEDKADSGQVLQTVWLAGSFVSACMDPSDLDITPIIDRDALATVQGKPGSKALKKLIGHREKVRDRFRVEPFPLPWVATASPLRPRGVNSSVRDYLETRGSLDDWWQRVRPEGAKQAPLVEHAMPRRGYLEVEP